MTFCSSLIVLLRSLSLSASDRLPSVHSSKINELATLGLALCQPGPFSPELPGWWGRPT